MPLRAVGSAGGERIQRGVDYDSIMLEKILSFSGIHEFQFQLFLVLFWNSTFQSLICVFQVFAVARSVFQFCAARVALIEASPNQFWKLSLR